MTPQSQKLGSSTFNRPKWLIRVTFDNDAATTFSLSTRELRTYITDNVGKHSNVPSTAGVVNKYVFPCVLSRFKDKLIKHIKIRSK